MSTKKRAIAAFRGAGSEVVLRLAGKKRPTMEEAAIRNNRIIATIEYPAMTQRIVKALRERDAAKAHAAKFSTGRRKGSPSVTTRDVRALADAHPRLKPKDLWRIAPEKILRKMEFGTFRNHVSRHRRGALKR